MTRQEWLAKFLELVDNNGPAISYRRYLGIHNAALPDHINRIGLYREELKELNAAAKIESLKKLTGGKDGPKAK